MSKDEIIAAIKECAERLGHAPSFAELRAKTKVTKRAVRRHFLRYTDALKECGLERRGAGYEVSQRHLFEDWAKLARKLGKVPTIQEYEFQSEYSVRPMIRWFTNWRSVAAGMAGYARKEGLEVEWADVLDIIARHLGPEQKDKRRLRTASGPVIPTRVRENEPIYGTPLMHEVMSYAPTNEMGVMMLFAAEAKRLGFKILRLQAACPDCEAMREVAPGKWQRVRIEFEFESRNYLAHGHAPGACDMIVCWEHNWEYSPVEVIELRAVVGQLAADER